MVSNWLLDWWKCCVDDTQTTPPSLYLFCAKVVYLSSCDPHHHQHGEVGLLNTFPHIVPYPVPNHSLLFKRSNLAFVTQLDFMQMWNALRKTPGAKAADLRMAVKSNHQIKALPLPETIKTYLEIEQTPIRTWSGEDKYFPSPHTDLAINVCFGLSYCSNFAQLEAVLQNLAAQKPHLAWQRDKINTNSTTIVSYLA